MVEHDLAAAHLQRRRAGLVGDLGRDIEQAEHLLHAHQRIPDLAIGEAQHVERHVELDQEGVHRHEVAERHAALGDAVARHHHDRDQPGRDDRALADIEQRQGAAGADRGHLVAAAADVVAPRLVRLVAEVLDGLVVQQAVDRLGVGLGVGIVHAAHELDAPFRQGDREHDVGRDHAQGDRREAPVVERPQDHADQADLEQGRQDVEGREADQELHPLGSAFDDPAQAAGLALEMETEAERVEMVEHFEGEVADRPLRHRREDRVAHLAERLGQHAGEAVGQDQRDRHRHHLGLAAQPVDGVLVEDRHVDVGELGQDQQHKPCDDAGTQRPFTLRPQMPAQDLQHGPRPVEADGRRTVVDRGRHGWACWGLWQWVALGAWAFYRAREPEVSPPVEHDFMSFRTALVVLALCCAAPSCAGPDDTPDPGRLRDHFRRHDRVSHRLHRQVRGQPLRHREPCLQGRHPEGADHAVRGPQPRAGAASCRRACSRRAARCRSWSAASRAPGSPSTGRAGW